ncbi:MAG TPA: hypothetical protein VM008_19400 [Phycisphaerae bacterium]|nr:hypothetical protein [Phycisphaerae bacterium]
MDMVKIEALLMDHALGGTSDEVGALVEAYVERDAAARARLEELRGTVGAAKRALASQPVLLPAYPRGALEHSMQRHLWKRRVVAGAAIAACIAVGFLIGDLWRGENRKTDIATRVASVPAQKSGVPVAAEMATVRDFWSTARLRASAEQASKETNAQSDRRIRIQSWNHIGDGL